MGKALLTIHSCPMFTMDHDLNITHSNQAWNEIFSEVSCLGPSMETSSLAAYLRWACCPPGCHDRNVEIGRRSGFVWRPCGIVVTFPSVFLYFSPRASYFPSSSSLRVSLTSCICPPSLPVSLSRLLSSHLSPSLNPSLSTHEYLYPVFTSINLCMDLLCVFSRRFSRLTNYCLWCFVLVISVLSRGISPHSKADPGRSSLPTRSGSNPAKVDQPTISKLASSQRSRTQQIPTWTMMICNPVKSNFRLSKLNAGSMNVKLLSVKRLTFAVGSRLNIEGNLKGVNLTSKAITRLESSSFGD